MNILLISPCIHPDKKTPKALMMPQLALYILQGLTPKEHKVKLVEEEVEELSFDEDCDLVGISTMTANAPRAYEVAREFRKRGKTVVMGGVHPTVVSEEAMMHADCVVIGEAEGVWEQLLLDFANNSLKKSYHVESPDLSRYVPKDFSRIQRKRLFNILPSMTTRGCPYNCEFCCVHDIFGKKVRHIPVENIVREVKESGGKNFMFLDDNIIGNPKYAKELFSALIPLKIKWVGQASISFVKDGDLMDLAIESGCTGLFIGIESVYEEQLKTMRKAISNIEKLEDAIKTIKNKGLHFHASLVFGFDNDTHETFAETLDFLVRNKISTASMNVLTPYPGTKIYERFKAEGRLLTNDWKYYDHSTVVFQPKNMTPAELQKGRAWTKREFYRTTSILKRFTGNLSHPLVYIAMNISHRKKSKMERKGLKKLVGEIEKFEPAVARKNPKKVISEV